MAEIDIINSKFDLQGFESGLYEGIVESFWDFIPNGEMKEIRVFYPNGQLSYYNNSLKYINKKI